MWVWVTGAAAADIRPIVPCATREQLAAAPLQRRGLLLGVGGPVGERDPYDVPNERTSEHFVVRWGDFDPVSPAQADTLLAAFELAWDVQIEDMGHTAPYGAGTYLFNVYVGDTGGGTPSAYGAGGYQMYDRDGYPMVVIARSSFFDPDYLDHTAVHEFYHAIQSESGRFPYDGISAWYWEATAEWAAIEADPDNPALGSFAPGYVWLPEIGIEAFDYPDQGTLAEFHQYGAFLFPYDLTHAFGRDIVTETWKDPGSEIDPMEVMRGLVESQGGDFDEAIREHVAHTVLLDHPLAEILDPHFDLFQSAYAGESAVSRGLSSWDDEGKVVGQAPQRHGSYVIVARGASKGTAHLRLTGDAEGTLGSPAEFSGTAIVSDGVNPTYTRIEFDRDGVATLDLELVDSDDLYVVVTPTAPFGFTTWDQERFPFQYSLSLDAEADPPDSVKDRVREKVRSCDHSGGSPLAPIALLALWARRRRAPG